MRNLFLLSLFGLFMMLSLGHTPVQSSFIAPACADENTDDNGNTNNETTTDDTTGTNNETGNNDSTSSNNDDTANNTAEFHCPDGITTCYTADGEEFTDVNNLAATAAGSEGDDDNGEALVSVVKPAHFRSF